MRQGPLKSVRWSALVLSLAASLIFSAGIQAADDYRYWYETYELVVQLIDEGRTAEASELLAPLLQGHPAPVSGKRLPGNRFIDYLPYFQRARIQLEQGDVRGAAHSLDISEAFGAIRQNRRNHSEFQELRKTVDTRQAALRSQGPAAPVPASSERP